MIGPAPTADDTTAGVVGSAVLTFGFRAGLFVLALVTNIVLARALGPNGRGTYAIAILVPSLLALLANLGIGNANVYHVSRSSLNKREIVGASLSVAIVVGVGVFAVLFVLTRFSPDGTLLGIKVGYLLITGVSVPFSLTTAFLQGVLHGERRFLHLNIVMLSQSVALLCFLVPIFVVTGNRVTISTAAWLGSTVVASATAIYFVAGRVPISLRTSLATIRELLRYGSLTYLSTLNSFVNYRFDQLIVNLIAGASQVGLYAVGTGLAEVIWFVPNAVTIALAPRVAAAEEAKAANLSAQAARSVAAVTVILAAALALVALPAILLFFGSAFAGSNSQTA